MMTRLLLLCVLLSVPLRLQAQTNAARFIRGADLSFIPQIEDLGGTYKLNGVQRDALDIFKENGVNYVRLRLWHTPADGYCGLPKTLAYAMRVKAKGFKFLLDIHYSDWWADPGKQNKPAAWASISFAALRESVYTYTKDVVQSLKDQGTLPDMVQIGNEITAGMLWPDGRVPTSNPTLAWQQFGELVKQGILGARDAAADTTMKIMIHIDRGGDNATAIWFYDNLLAQGVQFDVIGLSYYPWWHGSLTQMKNNINNLATRYNKDIILAETAYPWTTQSLNDGHGNIGVDPTKLPPGLAMSPQGQKAFLTSITSTLKQANNQRGAGFFYWEPAYISVPPIGSSWEHLTTFDFNGNALSSITAFRDLDSIPKVNVTLRINTATNTDTLKPSGFVQVRGEILGLGSSLMPSGELLTWDSYSQILPTNIGGDYWEYTLSMLRSDTLSFKLWTGHTSTTPTYLRLGWEGPVHPSDAPNVNARMCVAASRDTTLQVQFYNSSGNSVDQYWSPIRPQPDSIGVLFRVNLADLMKTGLFDPAVHGPVVVRGDSARSAGVLSWGSSKLILKRDTLSVGGGSFWSGVAYFPRTRIAAGTQIPYKFFVENGSFSGWESNISERTFGFPGNDTTLAWQFFNNRLVPTGVRTSSPGVPKEFFLYQNFPNPFNPTTVISYELSVASKVKLVVSDILGREVAVLVNEKKEPGNYAVTWNPDGLGSGVYLLRLTAGGYVQTRKMMLTK